MAVAPYILTGLLCFLFSAWLRCCSAHTHSGKPINENANGCTNIKLQCSMPEAATSFQFRAGCQPGECDSLTSYSRSNFSSAILDYYQHAEAVDFGEGKVDHHHEDHAAGQRRNRRSRRHTHSTTATASSCDCPSVSIESIYWSAVADATNQNITNVNVVIEVPQGDANSLSTYFEQDPNHVNAHLQAEGLNACRNWTLIQCCTPEATLDIRISSIFVILFSSCAGVAMPFFIGQDTRRDNFFMLRAFSGGVVLGLAFCHIIPSSTPLNGWTDYGSLNGVFVLIGIVVCTLWERVAEELLDVPHFHDAEHNLDQSSVRSSATVIQIESIDHLPCNIEPKEHAEPGAEGLGETLQVSKSKVKSAVRSIVTAHTVEMGIVVHTVVLGITVGMWTESRVALIGFMIAMVFHQFFEGISLSVCILAAGDSISTCKKLSLASVFALSFPLSICLGIGLNYSWVDDYAKELVSAALGAVSGGMLVYMGLISLMAEDFLLSEYVMMPSKRGLRLQLVGSLMVGMTIMAVLGIWG